MAPGWRVPGDEVARTWQALAGRVANAGGQARHHAALTTFAWALDGAPAPISGRLGPPDLACASAEHRAALMLAELGRLPTDEEWAALGSPDPPAVCRVSVEWGYGAWRVLAWLLHRGADSPVPLWEGHLRRKPWPLLPADARDAVGKAFAAAGLATIDLDPLGEPRVST